MKILRISDELHADIKRCAALHGQTINSLVEVLLRTALEDTLSPQDKEILAKFKMLHVSHVSQREREKKRENPPPRSPPHTPPLTPPLRERKKEREKSFVHFPNEPIKIGEKITKVKTGEEAAGMKKPGKINLALTPALDKSFNLFWSAYPRKSGKQTCRQLWAQLRPDDKLLEKMLTTLEWQRESKQWQEPRYIPMPATWLNQHRWDDEPTQVSTQTTWQW